MRGEIEVHFGGKKNSARGIAGFVISVVCIVSLIVLFVLSAVAGGTAGVFVGVAGMVIFAFGVVSLVLSLQGLQEQGVYNGLPLVGLILSGILLIVLFCIYITGIRV